MQFANDAHRKCYERVAPIMKELFGEMMRADTERPVFRLMLGSAVVQTAVYPWGDDDGVIGSRAYVTSGTELTAEFMKFLLTENADMRFGAFGIDSDGDVFFEHAIVASTADKVEVRSSVLAVVSTADRYDDQIVDRFGGRRMVDAS